MSIVEVIKNQNFFQKLEEKFKENKFANSVMFFCEDSFTSEVVLIYTSLMLNYPTYQLFDEKSAEYQRVLKDADLDIKLYPKNKEKLLVADSNDIVMETYVKPVNRENKIFIIENIDKSTEQAQNKLLKVLEEPPKNVYFLISCSQSDKVLPTIKSRCDKINVEKLTDDELKKICQSPLACMLSEGYAGRALMLEKNKDLQDIVDFAISLICELKNSSQVLRFSREFQDRKGNMELVLKTFSLALEDMVKIKTEKEELCTLKEYLPMLKSVESEFSVSAICEINSLISHFLEKLQFNANLSMAVDNFLLKVLEVKYLCK